MVSRRLLLSLSALVFLLMLGSVVAESGKEGIQRIKPPHRDLESTVIDGTGREATLRNTEGSFQGFDERKVGKSKVSVSMVAWLTLAMAAATGLGAVPFFFLELEPQWAGVCNGLAAGVMLAASFDLVQEGQSYGGGGNWVVFGIISGAVFIWLCKMVRNIVFVSSFSLSETFIIFNLIGVHFFIFTLRLQVKKKLLHV